ncbi:MAG TPA: FMN-dependent NADH-azoreductase [Clostridiaceae bacterium]|nr:FMN-dependent NADH-azoreductase [Clostridiaceae bacterium]
MKKLLYITCNSKPEYMSTSKIVGREFVNRFLAANPDHYLEELDLYKEDVPEINHKIFTGRAEPVSGEKYDALTESEKRQVEKIISLCDQFLSADTYVIAAPMWSLSFPSRLKRYIDCIIINNKTIKVSPEEVKGLLNDKERNMVYIQSSGGDYPMILSWKFNHGINYIKDIFKFLGISRFEKILVEGVDKLSIGKNEAIAKAFKDIDVVIDKLSGKVLV